MHCISLFSKQSTFCMQIVFVLYMDIHCMYFISLLPKTACKLITYLYCVLLYIVCVSFLQPKYISFNEIQYAKKCQLWHRCSILSKHWFAYSIYSVQVYAIITPTLIKKYKVAECSIEILKHDSH